MPYFLVDRFGGGVDTRRSAVAAPGGTMRQINNAFINKGGEIEKRKKWFRLEDVTDETTNNDNQANMYGPMRTFDYNSVWFHVTQEPSAAGEWSADGNGVVATDGRFQTALYDPGTSPGLLMAVGAHVLYADEILVSGISNIYDSSSYAVAQSIFTFSAGDVAPSSDGGLSGRSGSIIGTATAETDFVGRFLSSIGVSPTDYLLIKSDTGDPENDGGTGAAEIETRGQGVEIGRPFAIEHYYNQVAVFGERGIQFWDVAADGASFAYNRGIGGEVLTGIRATTPYADGDVLYLTANGIRSLRARDSSNFAEVTDIGSPIDQEVSDLLRGEPGAGNLALALIHEDLGQAWFFIMGKVFVLSRYPSAEVLAWSTFDVPDRDTNLDIGNIVNGQFVTLDYNLAVWDACPIGGTVCLRLGTSEVFVYGDSDPTENQYDDCLARVVTPYFTVDDPFTEKVFDGFDIACTGTWEVEYSIDSENEAWVSLGEIVGNSHMQGQIAIDATSNMIAFRLSSRSESAAKITQFGFHYTKTEVGD